MSKTHQSLEENNRCARFYSLTAAGTQLKAETAKWTDMATVVAAILDKKAGEI